MLRSGTMPYFSTGSMILWERGATLSSSTSLNSYFFFRKDKQPQELLKRREGFPRNRFHGQVPIFSVCKGVLNELRNLSLFHYFPLVDQYKYSWLVFRGGHTSLVCLGIPLQCGILSRLWTGNRVKNLCLGWHNNNRCVGLSPQL